MHTWSVDTQTLGASVVITLTSAPEEDVRADRTWMSLSPPPTFTRVRWASLESEAVPFQ